MWQWFPKLEYLWLYNNRLTGTLPQGLGCNGSFARLSQLDLSHNSLTGRLPAGCSLHPGNSGCLLALQEPSGLKYM